MLRIVWSTPRSGSTFYTEAIKLAVESLFTNVICHHEIFGRLFKKHYTTVYLDNDKKITTISDKYIKGPSFKLKPDLITRTIIKDYNEYGGTDGSSNFNDWFNFVSDMASSSSVCFVLHEHITELPEFVVKSLNVLSDGSSYIVRDRKEQLASYAIAKHTSSYIFTTDTEYRVNTDKLVYYTNQSGVKKFTESIINQVDLVKFNESISAANKLARSLGIFVQRYETLKHNDLVPVKKFFNSSYERLNEIDQLLLNNIIKES